VKDKIIAFGLTKLDKFLLVMRYPFQKDWMPNWVLKIKLIPYSWMVAPQEWGERHGWYDFCSGTYRRLTPEERAEAAGDE